MTACIIYEGVARLPGILARQFGSTSVFWTGGAPSTLSTAIPTVGGDFPLPAWSPKSTTAYLCNPNRHTIQSWSPFPFSSNASDAGLYGNGRRRDYSFRMGLRLFVVARWRAFRKLTPPPSRITVCLPTGTSTTRRLLIWTRQPSRRFALSTPRRELHRSLEPMPPSSQRVSRSLGIQR